MDMKKRLSERDKLDMAEQKMRILSAYNWRCVHCSGVAIFLGHKIAQTKTNIKLYGLQVINHEKNLLPVCSNPRCNDACNIGGRPEEVRQLVKEIQAALDEEKKKV